MGESLPTQVLRYWLASVRMEEALGTRPRARRTPPADGPVHIELSHPVEGVEYLRLPCDESLWRVAAHQSELQAPLDAAAAGFFETWLSRQYRASPVRTTKRAAKEGEERVQHLLAFPVVHLPRHELAGLLRCEVQLDFLQASGGLFTAPDYKARRAQRWPEPPTALRVVGGAAPGEGRLPFFVDTRLLQEQLGVEPEEIDAFFARLSEQAEQAEEGDSPVSARSMLLDVCALLALPADSAPDDDTLDEAALLGLLVDRMNRRLAQRPSSARAYGVAIVVDAQQARSTWHLQRELQLLIEEGRKPAERETRPALDAYLAGEAPEVGRGLQRAAYPGSTLTEPQRAAAEHFLGSSLTAVQGPPGTGKTTLILHLAAQHVLEQVDGLADGGQMGHRLLIVASTNNRAVDNVIEPLNLDAALNGQGLPLALRTGSREVCEKVTTRQLRDAMHWFARHAQQGDAQKAAASQALQESLEHYRELRTRLLEAEAGRVLRMQQEASRTRLTRELGQLQSALAIQTEPPAALPALDAADGALLQRAVAQLDSLAVLASAAVSERSVKRLDKAHAKFHAKLGGALQALLERHTGATWPLPPELASEDPEEVIEAWEEALEQAVGRLDPLVDALTTAAESQRLREERSRIEAALVETNTALRAAAPENEATTAALDPLRGELFAAALAVRRAWAIVHAGDLHDALEVAVKCSAAERSMRTLFRAEDDAGRWLRRLCGVWGCTLLSMANAVPAESSALDRVIIDEAGQCHPAHATAALLRCRSALIIGDVHQLEPVVGLTRRDEARVRAHANVRLTDAQLAPYRVFAGSHGSAQSLADRAVGGPLRLIDHFRCQPPIIALCDAFCGYGLRVHTAPASRSAQAACLHAPLLFDAVDGQQERLGGSWVNRRELDACLRLLERLLGAGIPSDDIALITPYRGQLELLQRAVAQRGIPIDRGLRPDDQLSLFGASNRAGGGLTLGTVHRFQGGERSVVLFSSVATEPASLTFLNGRANLLNVTVSRAREHLVTLGHPAALASGRYTRHLTAGEALGPRR